MSLNTSTSRNSVGNAAIWRSSSSASAVAIIAASADVLLSGWPLLSTSKRSRSLSASILTNASARFSFSQVKAVFLTMVSSQARPFAPENRSIARNALMQASCTTSSASARLRVSHRAKASASARYGTTTVSNLLLSSFGLKRVPYTTDSEWNQKFPSPVGKCDRSSKPLG